VAVQGYRRQCGSDAQTIKRSWTVAYIVPALLLTSQHRQRADAVTLGMSVKPGVSDSELWTVVFSTVERIGSDDKTRWWIWLIRGRSWSLARYFVISSTSLFRTATSEKTFLVNRRLPVCFENWSRAELTTERHRVWLEWEKDRGRQSRTKCEVDLSSRSNKSWHVRRSDGRSLVDTSWGGRSDENCPVVAPRHLSKYNDSQSEWVADQLQCDTYSMTLTIRL